MRQFCGEIPKLPAALSFFDLFTRDYNTNAKVLKQPNELKELFERLPGMKFDELNDDSENASKS